MNTKTTFIGIAKAVLAVGYMAFKSMNGHPLTETDMAIVSLAFMSAFSGVFQADAKSVEKIASAQQAAAHAPVVEEKKPV